MESTSHYEQALSGKICTECGRGYPDEVTKCPEDGGELTRRKEAELIGTRIADHYQILSLVGMGGMSAVYKAKHELLDKIVAIKLLHQHLVTQVGSLKRFQQEAKAVSHLSHPNIVGVHEFGILNEGQPYLIMDYLQGESLADRLRSQGPIPADKAVEIFVQICDALAHAHHKGIIHRDMKPSNVMLVKHGESNDFVKLVDFGIAKLMPHAELEGQRLTATGEVFGSPVYMSPEQCMGQPLDVRSDIYSMGCVMYETLCGQPPYIGQNIMETMYMRLSERPAAFVAELRVPPQLEEIIFMTLAQDPVDRHQNMKELLDALHESVSSPSKATWPLLTGIRRTLRTKNLLKRKRTFRDEMMWAAVAATLSLGGLMVWGETTHMWPWQSSELRPETMWRKHDIAGQKAFDSGKLPEAEHAYQLAVAEAEKFGETDRRLANTLIKLAQVYEAEHKTEELQKVFNRIETWKEASGEPIEAEDEDARLDTMADLTLNLAPKVVQKDRWPEYQNLVDKLTNLAESCRKADNYKKAEQLMEKALEIETAALGPDSSNTVKTVIALGDLYMELGKYQDAQDQFKKALAVQFKTLGENAADNASLYNRIAFAYEQQGKYEKSEEFFKKAVALYESQYGTDDPQLASGLDGLAGLYRLEGKFKEAEALFARALKIYEKANGSKSESVAIACNNLAGLYFERAEYDRALAEYRRSLAIYERLNGPDDLTVATILNNIAAVEFKQNKLDEAEPTLRRALRIRERNLQLSHPAIAQSQNALAEIYRKQHRYMDAAPLYEEALTITEANYGSRHPEVATILSSLGELAYDQGKYREAEDFYKLALDIRQNNYKEDNAETASSLNQLAMAYLKQSRYQDAEPLFKRALAMRVKLFGHDNAHVGETLDGYGDLLISTNRIAEGCVDKGKAFSICVTSSLPKLH